MAGRRVRLASRFSAVDGRKRQGFNTEGTEGEHRERGESVIAL